MVYGYVKDTLIANALLHLPYLPPPDDTVAPEDLQVCTYHKQYAD